ncbi:hypothetical protein V1477_019134 [Vespula maculifrons]|uniref:Uncharacterized protein n=4 Tax=Vespula TaxID=7451 RepID=A0A834MS75_VESGE|nr:hypothetical protein HZH66_014410 [Vespula vulgaris]KAF7381048.1 hypothetical protein HZH68_015923 [Vespula germanica]KAF7392148.1 hypothetical protein H0235_017147 [Vespula pensylvanica]
MYSAAADTYSILEVELLNLNPPKLSLRLEDAINSSFESSSTPWQGSTKFEDKTEASKELVMLDSDPISPSVFTKVPFHVTNGWGYTG